MQQHTSLTSTLTVIPSKVSIRDAGFILFVCLLGFKLCEWLHKSLYETYAWVIMMCKHMSGYTQDTSLFLLCVYVCMCECITGKQWLMSALFSSVSWSVPEAYERAPAFLCPEPKHCKDSTCSLYCSAVGLSNHELIGAHEWLLSEHPSLGAARLTWCPLPNPQHPREMTHVVLIQHKLKLVVQHYSLCVNSRVWGQHSYTFRLI